jgi:ferredoxin
MSKRLKINPILCDGFGYCMDLFPEGIAKDPWGFPIIFDTPVSGELRKHANAAIRKCPRNALFLTEDD